MRIAITGGTGFLGRYIIRQLAREGHTLQCWHRKNSDLSGFEDIARQIVWISGELGNEKSFTPLLQDVDAVVHSALAWQPERGTRTPEEGDLLAFLETNFMASIRLFQRAYQQNIPRFVFISTCAVHEVILDDRPLDETHPLWPTRHYGAHKAALEKFVHSYGLGQNWNICALRPTGIYGVAHPASASKWFDLIGQVVRGENIVSAKGGKEVHAADVAKAVSLLLRADFEKVAGRAFNCYDMYISEEHVARIAKEISGSDSEISTSNQGPKHQIANGKIRDLGMNFGSELLLRDTVAALVKAYQEKQAR